MLPSFSLYTNTETFGSNGNICFSPLKAAIITEGRKKET